MCLIKSRYNVRKKIFIRIFIQRKKKKKQHYFYTNWKNKKQLKKLVVPSRDVQ